MGKRKHVNKARRSLMRQYAGEDSKEIFKQCKINFLKNYMTLTKEHGSITEMDSEVFNNFISNVNGYYKCRMKQLRVEYEKETVIKNIKEESQWRVMMNTLINAHKQDKPEKIVSVLHDMTV